MRFASSRLLHSLTARLLCTYLVALIVTVCFILRVVWIRSSQDADVITQAQLHEAADLIQQSLRFDSAGLPSAVVPPHDVSGMLHGFADDLKYRVLDRSGGVIISSDHDGAALTPHGQPFDPTPESFTLTAGGEVLVVETQPVVHGMQTYYLQVGISRRLSAFIQALSVRIRVGDALRFASASILAIAVALYFTLRKVLKPLRETSAAATRIDTHSISNRLATRNLPMEFLPLVDAFNSTLDRLEKGYVVQRAFLASAAHELKTPLALIRAQLDMDGATSREVLLQEIDRMARQVNQLLHLAEASETQNYVFEYVDLAAVTEDVVDYLRRLAERRQVYVDMRCVPGSFGLQADRGALFMLLKNLVENAIQHSPVGGFVALTVDADHLYVRDEGPGIAADELPKLFKRFWRGPTRRNEGAGLGLSICAEIAAAHNWELTARSTGRGAEFILAFRVNTASGITHPASRVGGHSHGSGSPPSEIPSNSGVER